jgi:membrane protease YdiL (CAAX protease family)
MNKVADWIKLNQLTAFFVITFIISWGLGFTLGAVMERNQFLLLPLVFVAVCGPGLAGIIISAVINTQPREGNHNKFWIAFLAAWFVSAVVYLANLIFIEKTPLSPMVIGLFTISVLPVAFVIASAYSPIPSVKSYLASLTRPRGVWLWVIMALLFFPGLVILSIPLNNLLQGESELFARYPEINFSLIYLVIIKFFYQLFFFNATGEEAGWRGFALPRLQARTSPLMAAFIIALFWAPWHYFFWQAQGQPVRTLEYWVWIYPGTFLFSVLIVWLCNRGRGNILVAGIAHAATNTTIVIFGPRNVPDLYPVWAIAALVVVLVDRMWKKLPSDHPVVYPLPELNAQPGLQLWLSERESIQS